MCKGALMLRFLRYLNRLRLGQTPIFVEYEYDFQPRWSDGGNPFILEIISRNKSKIDENLRSFRDLLPLIAHLSGDAAPSPRVNWKNHFIPALDAFSLMWAASRSKSTFIEVGSGNSTIFIRRSIEYHGLKTRLVSVDPYPRVEINSLCDEIVRKPLEKVDLALFEQLQPGDVLFVDNSHRSFMNSDVTVVMLDILPRLKPGVLVGFHDIFLPFDYLETWSGRAYNEQYLLGSYLLANPDYFNLQLCNYYTWSRGAHVEPLAAIWNILGAEVRDRSASAFWGIKT
jgi:hypothetical protein